MRRRLAAAALAAAAAGCDLLTPGSTDGAETTVVARRIDLTVDVLARGEIEATTASPIAVPRVPTGALKVQRIVEEGTLVAPGDVVVVFDDTTLNVELDNHKATFRSTGRQIDRTQLQSTIETDAIAVMKQVAELERDNLRTFEIVDRAIYSEREILEDAVRLDNAQGTIVFADASLLLRGEYYDIEESILDVERGQAAGKIERVETSLGSLVLEAPIGGLVVYRKNWRGSTVGVGDTLWPGNVILSIVDPDHLALEAFVLERDAAGLAAGAEATVTVDARAGRIFAGRVASVAELSRPIEQDSPVKYFETRIEILDDTGPLSPGMKGEARIVTARLAQAVVVPRSAVRGPADAPFVLVRDGSRIVRREVRLGAGDLVRVAIEDGLADGERVVLGRASDPGEPATLAGELPAGAAPGGPAERGRGAGGGSRSRSAARGG